MKQNVTPVAVIVALIILAIVVAGIWWFTMGKSGKKGSGHEVNTQTMQPKTPQEAAERGYKPGPAGPSPGMGQRGMGGPPSGKQGR